MADKATLIPSDSDTIVLDLEPDAGEFARLNSSIEVKQGVIDIGSRKSPFKCSIARVGEVHGHGNFDGKILPASLLTFKVVMDSLTNRPRRIKSASLELIFENGQDEGEVESAPNVVASAPGRPPMYLNFSKKSIANSSGVEVGAGTGGLASIRGVWHTTRSTNLEEARFATIKAYAQSSDSSHSSSNSAYWFLEENTSQKSAVPTDFSLAVLLTRTEGRFLCSIKVNLHVDLQQHVKEWSDWIIDWNRTSRYWAFDPHHMRPIKLVNGKAVDQGSLEKLVDEGEGLAELVKVAKLPYEQILGGL
ncbi:hypothetical protein GP486_002691 [Trichoglossum hirsutum]|uniref:Uncharacterized protein n=1 Tax=Trichoglossum hirsutum TaxID=265104 RepID=A0A9P8RRF4_9PEZI|nr:hypothetical protein GP486_002691 [Trichoglossum hirsutum]